MFKIKVPNNYNASSKQIKENKELARISFFVHNRFTDLIFSIKNEDNNIEKYKFSNVEKLLESDFKNLWEFKNLIIADNSILNIFKIKIEWVIWWPIFQESIDMLLVMTEDIKKRQIIIQEYFKCLDYIITSYFEKLSRYWYIKYSRYSYWDTDLMLLFDFKYNIIKSWEQVKNQIQEDLKIYLNINEKAEVLIFPKIDTVEKGTEDCWDNIIDFKKKKRRGIFNF